MSATAVRELARALKELQPASTDGRITATLADDDDATVWHLQLRYAAADAANDAVVVQVAVRFDATATKLPIVHVLAPRLSASFIHDGAVCLTDLGHGGFRYDAASVVALVETLHFKLDPQCAAGVDVSIADPSGRFSEAERQAGEALIRNAHPTWSPARATERSGTTDSFPDAAAAAPGSQNNNGAGSAETELLEPADYEEANRLLESIEATLAAAKTRGALGVTLCVPRLPAPAEPPQRAEDGKELPPPADLRGGSIVIDDSMAPLRIVVARDSSSADAIDDPETAPLMRADFVVGAGGLLELDGIKLAGTLRADAGGRIRAEHCSIAAAARVQRALISTGAGSSIELRHCCAELSRGLAGRAGAASIAGRGQGSSSSSDSSGVSTPASSSASSSSFDPTDHALPAAQVATFGDGQVAVADGGGALHCFATALAGTIRVAGGALTLERCCLMAPTRGILAVEGARVVATGTGFVGRGALTTEEAEKKDAPKSWGVDAFASKVELRGCALTDFHFMINAREATHATLEDASIRRTTAAMWVDASTLFATRCRVIETGQLAMIALRGGLVCVDGCDFTAERTGIETQSGARAVVSDTHLSARFALVGTEGSTTHATRVRVTGSHIAFAIGGGKLIDVECAEDTTACGLLVPAGRVVLRQPGNAFCRDKPRYKICGGVTAMEVKDGGELDAEDAAFVFVPKPKGSTGCALVHNGGKGTFKNCRFSATNPPELWAVAAARGGVIRLSRCEVLPGCFQTGWFVEEKGELHAEDSVIRGGLMAVEAVDEGTTLTASGCDIRGAPASIVARSGSVVKVGKCKLTGRTERHDAGTMLELSECRRTGDPADVVVDKNANARQPQPPQPPAAAAAAATSSSTATPDHKPLEHWQRAAMAVVVAVAGLAALKRTSKQRGV